jgi:hypothetical protein
MNTKALIALFAILIHSRAYSDEWVRFSASRPRDLPGVPFGLLSTQGGQKSGLSADGWYRYIVGRAPVTLHGKKEANKMFRPRVTYQVAVQGKTKWKEIRSDVQETDGDAITVDPEHPGVAVVIDMDPFRASIGVYRYGRIVLENGDATDFVIDDLLPTMDESEHGDGNFKTEIIYSKDELKKEGFTDQWLAEPITLVAVTAIGGRIIGDFVYSNQTKEVVKLSGFRTLDGDFWPQSLLEVGNKNSDDWAIERKGRSHRVRNCQRKGRELPCFPE